MTLPAFLPYLICLSTSFLNPLPADSPTRSVNQLAIGAQQPVGNTATGWQYEQKRGSDNARLRSGNTIQFAYPHTQQETVTLGIRSRNGDTYLYLESANGLFTRSFQSGTALVQIDQQRPAIYALSAAANGRANIVFVDDADRLLTQLRKSRVTSVRLQFAGQPDRTLQFQTAGLRWEH